jgi:hypothetical protein
MKNNAINKPPVHDEWVEVLRNYEYVQPNKFKGTFSFHREKHNCKANN